MVVTTACTLMLAIIVLIASRPRFRETSLGSAHAWGSAAMVVWGAAFVCDQFLTTMDRPIVEQLWYAAALLTLTPMVAVLGARRPGVGPWNWFVLIPMLAVFELHAMTTWGLQGGNHQLTLPTPMLIGVGVVLVMGAGNYLLTRYSLSALATAASVLLVLLPLTSLVHWEPATVQTMRAIATLVLSAAVLLATRQSRLPTLDANPLNRIWFDFWDTFGLVWAMRLSERLNSRAEAEQWPYRIGPSGFAPVNDSPPSGNASPSPSSMATNLAGDGIDASAPADEVLSTVIQGIKWTMQRFVTEQWIETRLSPQSVTSPRSDGPE